MPQAVAHRRNRAEMPAQTANPNMKGPRNRKSNPELDDTRVADRAHSSDLRAESSVVGRHAVVFRYEGMPESVVQEHLFRRFRGSLLNECISPVERARLALNATMDLDDLGDPVHIEMPAPDVVLLIDTGPALRTSSIRAK